jgi:hypothetical protein
MSLQHQESAAFEVMELAARPSKIIASICSMALSDRLVLWLGTYSTSKCESIEDMLAVLLKFYGKGPVYVNWHGELFMMSY